MVITGNNEREIKKLQDELSVRFDMKSLGELRHFIGLEVENREDGIFVSQKGYAMKLVERFLSSPRKGYLEAAKKILKYVNATQDMRLLFKKNADLVLDLGSAGICFTAIFSRTLEDPDVELLAAEAVVGEATDEVEVGPLHRDELVQTGLVDTDRSAGAAAAEIIQAHHHPIHPLLVILEY
ncbi:hypothetical protein ZIOFF_073298 [Zingiber officinale]|uniref:Reverse transcriptase Ty1/copia-type domain-containing protein n=1 Tax=Zingiber officinale TaxID=94328 RepID=A0A8J5BBU4_ZINOF|nr:hypothetical protein ZIOFF_073298 [Zingiber officinale]